MAYSANMLWMETFCFYCSVRLGVIVSAVFSFFQGFVSIVLFGLYGSPIFKSAKQFIDRDEQHSQDPIIRNIVEGLAERPQRYMILFDVIYVIHMIACGSAAYGALKLRKSYLVPYMVTQFVIFVATLSNHIIAMVVLKRIVNLGILIGITLAGGFYILFIGYSWAGAVALHQMLVLVKSEKYKALYGTDPMAPIERNGILLGHATVETVKIFLTPNDNGFSPQKHMELGGVERERRRFGRKIITVIPADTSDTRMANDVMNFGNWHWNEVVGVRTGFK